MTKRPAYARSLIPSQVRLTFTRQDHWRTRRHIQCAREGTSMPRIPRVFCFNSALDMSSTFPKIPKSGTILRIWACAFFKPHNTLVSLESLPAYNYAPAQQYPVFFHGVCIFVWENDTWDYNALPSRVDVCCSRFGYAAYAKLKCGWGQRKKIFV